jgi:hypothetical protein
MYYLSSVYRLAPGGGGPEPVSFEFAILQEEELTELESSELSDDVPEVVSDFDDALEDQAATELDPAVQAPALEIARLGSMPTLGGAGEGGGGLGGLSGGAGTSFFGVSSRGTRFAYIVDRSGSMGNSQKMQIAKREMAASIDGLPDYAYFHVVLFSSDIVGMPGGRAWIRARKPAVSRFLRWLNDVDPGGGTEPMGAFYEVFALDVPPDVIFFLTDGEIPDETADLVGELNDRGGGVIINTIAFGDARSQEQLRRIASESGGVYLYVPQENP